MKTTFNFLTAISVLMLTTFVCEAAVPASDNFSSAVSAVSESQKKPRKKSEVKEVLFYVHLHCENCVKKVQENIAFEKGVKALEVSLENQTVNIKYDASKTSETTLKAAIEKLGYPVADCAEQVHGHEHHDDLQHN